MPRWATPDVFLVIRPPAVRLRFTADCVLARDFWVRIDLRSPPALFTSLLLIVSLASLVVCCLFRLISARASLTMARPPLFPTPSLALADD